MLEFSKKTNQLMQSKYKYQLQKYFVQGVMIGAVKG